MKTRSDDISPPFLVKALGGPRTVLIKILNTYRNQKSETSKCTNPASKNRGRNFGIATANNLAHRGTLGKAIRKGTKKATGFKKIGSNTNNTRWLQSSRTNIALLALACKLNHTTRKEILQQPDLLLLVTQILMEFPDQDKFIRLCCIRTLACVFIFGDQSDENNDSIDSNFRDATVTSQVVSTFSRLIHEAMRDVSDSLELSTVQHRSYASASQLFSR